MQKKSGPTLYPDNVTLQLVWANLRKPHPADVELKVSTGATLVEFQCRLLDDLLNTLRKTQMKDRAEVLKTIRELCLKADEAFAVEYRGLLEKLRVVPDCDQLVLRATGLEAAFNGSLNAFLSLAADAHRGDVRVLICKASGGIRVIGEAELLPTGSTDEVSEDLAQACEADPARVGEILKGVIEKLRSKLGVEDPDGADENQR